MSDATKSIDASVDSPPLRPAGGKSSSLPWVMTAAAAVTAAAFAVHDPEAARTTIIKVTEAIRGLQALLHSGGTSHEKVALEKTGRES
jgi:hypothetical protein